MRKASRCHEIQPWVRVVAGRRLRYTGHNSKLATSRAPVRIRILRKFCCIRIVRLVATLRGLGEILRLRPMLSDHLMADAAANGLMEARGQLAIQPRHHCCQEGKKLGSDGFWGFSPRLSGWEASSWHGNAL